MAIKLAEQTNGPHIFMRLRLDSGRVEEICEKYRHGASCHRNPEKNAAICGLCCI